MIILRPYELKIYPVVPRSEWREPSLSMPRDMFGNPEWSVLFNVSAWLDGCEVWKGWFESRDDADAFLWAAVTRTLHIQRSLCHIPNPIWSPGWYKDEDIVWQYATTNYFTSGTSTTIPSDWNSASNTITAIGGGANGADGTFDGKTGYAGVGGGGGACSRVTNQSYTASASRTRQIGASGTDTFLKDDGNSTNAVLAKGAGSAGTQAGGDAASGTGTTKYSGGNGYAVSAADGGGGGGAASATANGSNATGTGGANSGSGASGGSANTNGSAGTELGSGYGAGGGGGAGTGANVGKNGGNYGGGGGGGSAGGSTIAGGVAAGGLLVMEYTPAAGMKTGFNMPNGW